jgi:hypothetical protein
MALARMQAAGLAIAALSSQASACESTRGRILKRDQRSLIAWMEDLTACRELIGQVGWWDE